MVCFVKGWKPEKFVLSSVWLKYTFLRKWFRIVTTYILVHTIYTKICCGVISLANA